MLQVVVTLISCSLLLKDSQIFIEGFLQGIHFICRLLLSELNFTFDPIMQSRVLDHLVIFDFSDLCLDNRVSFLNLVVRNLRDHRFDLVFDVFNETTSVLCVHLRSLLDHHVGIDVRTRLVSCYHLRLSLSAQELRASVSFCSRHLILAHFYAWASRLSGALSWHLRHLKLPVYHLHWDHHWLSVGSWNHDHLHSIRSCLDCATATHQLAILRLRLLSLCVASICTSAS